MKTYFPKINPETLKLKPAEKFCLVVDEIPSSGYSWEFRASAGIELMADSFRDHDHKLKEQGVDPKYLAEEIEDPEICGNRVNRLLVFKAGQSGKLELKLMPPGKHQAPEKNIELEVETNENF